MISASAGFLFRRYVRETVPIALPWLAICEALATWCGPQRTVNASPSCVIILKSDASGDGVPKTTSRAVSDQRSMRVRGVHSVASTLAVVTPGSYARARYLYGSGVEPIRCLLIDQMFVDNEHRK